MITFYSSDLDPNSGSAVLDDDASRHARARRLKAGESVRLVNGHGLVAEGTLSDVGRGDIRVELQRYSTAPRPTPLELLVPVADKERMLWVAEKSVELQVTRWVPVMFTRSRSVTPRGEGPRFAEKVAARMRGALEQSGGAWLPAISGELDTREALAQVAAGMTKLLLDVSGAPLPAKPLSGAVALAVGPEGGLEAEEKDVALEMGWSPASLVGSTLRFETAAIAALAVVRATQLEMGARHGD